ncbi:MAG: hypothetical protein ACAI25_07440, partial [Planctomycetota bacterium]
MRKAASFAVLAGLVGVVALLARVEDGARRASPPRPSPSPAPRLKAAEGAHLGPSSPASTKLVTVAAAHSASIEISKTPLAVALDLEQRLLAASGPDGD